MSRSPKPVHEAKQSALDALDVLLSSGYPRSPDKLAALREVAASAARMVCNLEQWARDAEAAESRRAA